MEDMDQLESENKKLKEEVAKKTDEIVELRSGFLSSTKLFQAKFFTPAAPPVFSTTCTENFYCTERFALELLIALQMHSDPRQEMKEMKWQIN